MAWWYRTWMYGVMVQVMNVTSVNKISPKQTNDRLSSWRPINTAAGEKDVKITWTSRQDFDNYQHPVDWPRNNMLRPHVKMADRKRTLSLGLRPQNPQLRPFRYHARRRGKSSRKRKELLKRVLLLACGFRCSCLLLSLRKRSAVAREGTRHWEHALARISRRSVSNFSRGLVEEKRVTWELAFESKPELVSEMAQQTTRVWEGHRREKTAVSILDEPADEYSLQA